MLDMEGKISSEDKREKELERGFREWRQKSKNYREVGKKKRNKSD